MSHRKIKCESNEADNCSEVDNLDSEELPVINLVLHPDNPQNISALAANVPLFIKKLWKIVNDDSNKEIISWNKSGDGFVIQDQLGFISQTLPKYFKHNQLSSFVRQLNLYDFHKIQPIERDEFQFTHPFFMKDIPQLLPLIKRKIPAGRQKTNTRSNENPPHAPIVQELVGTIKDIKDKNEAITADMSKLRQENAALWREMNTLRLKYSKQTKIINKLIHFLIAYMQKHHNSRKGGRTVSAANSNKYLKTGPKIMELDYRYKNNPHEFWSDFDNQSINHSGEEVYTVVEPPECQPESDHGSDIAKSPNMRVSSTIDELLPNSNAFNHMGGSSSNSALPQFDYTSSLPSSSQASKSALQRAGGSTDNMGYLIDNSRVEMTTIKELIKNLSSDDMATFYKLVNENCKVQEDDLNFESENELVSLSQMSSFPVHQELANDISENGLEPLENIIENHSGDIDVPVPSSLDNIEQHDAVNSLLAHPSSSTQKNDVTESSTLPTIDDGGLELIGIGDDIFNTDDILNNVSVDQFFNIN